MNSRTISTDAVITGTLWVLTGAFFVASWLVYFAGHQELALMIALSGCPVVAAAMVGQIRCYTRRVCGLVRATRLEGGDAGIHSLR